VCAPQRRQHTDPGRREHNAGVEHHMARRNVTPTGSDVLPRRCRAMNQDRAIPGRRLFHHHDGVSAIGQRRASGNLYATTGRDTFG